MPRVHLKKGQDKKGIVANVLGTYELHYLQRTLDRPEERTVHEPVQEESSLVWMGGTPVTGALPSAPAVPACSHVLLEDARE